LVALGCLILAGTAQAQWKIANSSQPFTSPSEGSGPFDLFHVYPLRSNPSAVQSRDYAHNPWGNVYWQQDPGNPSAYGMTGWIPTYVIYYGNGFTATQKSLIDTFVGNFKDNPVWNIAKSRYGGGNPYFDRRVEIACSTSCYNVWWGNCFPCNLNQWEEQGVITSLFNLNKVPRNTNAIYLLVLGTDINYSFSDPRSQKQNCATHDVHDGEYSSLYRYITLPLIKNSASACNFLKAVGYPNNDLVVDNAVAMLAHEMLEVVNNNYLDSWSYAIADKCANQVVGVGTRGTNANVLVGGQKYLISPVWDSWNNVCSMGL